MPFGIGLLSHTIKARTHCLLTLGLLFFCVGGSSVQAKTETLSPQKAYYIVQPGDTLYSVAWRYGLDYQDIIALNQLKAPYVFYPHQKLLLAKSAHTARKGLDHPLVINKHLSSLPPLSHVSVKLSSPWIWPVKGPILHSYAPYSNPPRKGIDIKGLVNTPIRAIATGTVVYSGTGIPGYGHLIIIKHNSHYLSAYGYNARNEVKEGMAVKQGQIIALMGQYKHSAYVLHFEIRYNGLSVNPLYLLPPQR